MAVGNNNKIQAGQHAITHVFPQKKMFLKNVLTNLESVKKKKRNSNGNKIYKTRSINSSIK